MLIGNGGGEYCVSSHKILYQWKRRCLNRPSSLHDRSRVRVSLSSCSETSTGYRKSLQSYTIWRLSINEGVPMANLENVLQQVRDVRKQAQLRVEKLDEVIHSLVGLNGSAPSRNGAGRSRTLSVSARRRISIAQKARWARVRGRNVVSIASKRRKSTISAAGRKRIAAAQRARWAKVRAQQ